VIVSLLPTSSDPAAIVIFAIPPLNAVAAEV
jgi:hypothetical protein